MPFGPGLQSFEAKAHGVSRRLTSPDDSSRRVDGREVPTVVYPRANSRPPEPVVVQVGKRAALLVLDVASDDLSATDDPVRAVVRRANPLDVEDAVL